MGSSVNFFSKSHTANLRVFHGGQFVTNKKKTEYVRCSDKGAMYMKMGMDEICYFNLAHLVKTELGYDEVGELWYRRKGLTLFNGRKRFLTDADLEPFLATKDKNGFVNLYVVHPVRATSNTVGVGERILNSHLSQQSNNNTGPTKDAQISAENPNSSTKSPSSFSTQPQKFNIPKPRSKLQKLPLKNPLQTKKSTEKRVEGPVTRVHENSDVRVEEVSVEQNNGPMVEENTALNVEESPGERGQQSDEEGSEISLIDSEDEEDDDDLFVEYVDDDVLVK